MDELSMRNIGGKEYNIMHPFLKDDAHLLSALRFVITYNLSKSLSNLDNAVVDSPRRTKLLNKDLVTRICHNAEERNQKHIALER